ncbi:flagellar export chaperone FlgN [Anaerosolibacter sp.]|uniref:flagellar export chaperone FlgN n=1 Tax=Anaerosolibacter sp. TaxID=1872527 RepID=UPI0039EE5EB3
MNIEARIHQLTEILHKKIVVLEEILKTTTTQGNLIKSGLIDQLAKVIEEKQQYMNEINKLDSTFLEHYQMVKAHFNVQSIEMLDVRQYPALVSLKQHATKVISILKQIEELDRLNNEKFNAHFEALKQDMNKLRTEKQNKKILSSYGKKYTHPQGVFVDNKDR